MKVCALCGRCYDDSVVSCTEDGSPILSKSRDGDQEMIAGYRLECLVESGIKGETYRARETESGRSCLIQILSADEIGRDRFLLQHLVVALKFRLQDAERRATDCTLNWPRPLRRRQAQQCHTDDEGQSFHHDRIIRRGGSITSNEAAYFTTSLPVDAFFPLPLPRRRGDET